MDAYLEPDSNKAFTTIKHQICIILFKEELQTRVESSKYIISFAVFFHGLKHQILGGLTSERLMVIWGGVGDSKTIKLAAKICNLGVLVNYLNLMLGIILESLLHLQLVILCGIPTLAHLLLLGLFLKKSCGWKII